MRGVSCATPVMDGESDAQRVDSPPCRSLECSGTGGVLEVQDLVYRPGESFGRHAHAFSSMFVVLGGSVREWRGGKPVACGSGSVGFIPSGVEHRSEFGKGPGSPTHTLNVVLDEGLLEGLPRADGPIYLDGLHAAASVHRLKMACRDGQGVPLSVEEAALVLVTLLLDPMNSHDRSGRNLSRQHAPSWLWPVVAMIRECFASPLDLAWVSEVAGRHPAHVSRAFKALFACSITEYVMFLRVQHACGLLRSPTSGVSEGSAPTHRENLAAIAVRCGFYDQSQFTRIFTRMVRMTPGEYRRTFDRSRPLPPR